MAKTIAFDYDSIKDRVITNLSSQSEWASFLNYGVIDNIVSSIVNELSYEIQYSEYLSYENYWNLARNRSSLLQMSPMHGYIVPRKQSSSGTVRVSTSKTFDSSYDKDVYINKFFQFSNKSLYVCADDDYVLNANENYIDIPCHQGSVNTVSFLAEGKSYEEKTIHDDSIDNSFFTLTVNGILWTQVDSLFTCDSTTESYQIKTLPDFSGITIRFGNNVFGKQLSKNDEIIFTYLSTDGADGNIYTSDVITSVETQAFDENGKVVKLYCTNTSSFIGGKDYPTLEEIRELSPQVYQTGNRASSTSDYETILKQMDGLGKISVWGAYEILKDANKDPWEFISSEENLIHIAVLDSNNEDITELKKNEIINEIHDKCDPTDLFYFETVSKIPMIFHVDATITSSAYTTSEVESNIKTALSEKYGIDNMNFGDDVYDSDYVRLIDETEGVENHISYVELYSETKIFTSAYVGTFRLPIYPIDYSSVKIYIKDDSDDSDYKLFATCDSVGSIIGNDEYITTESTINLNTGEGVLRVSSGLTSDYANYTFKILYQYISRNLINSSRKNILYYDGSEVTLSYN